MSLVLLGVIYLAFISLGLPDSLLGSAWPVMKTDLNVPSSYMGIISMIISGGTIISGLMSERLIKKLTTRFVVLISVFLTAMALFGFSVSDKLYKLCLWAIPYGLGAGAIDAALNNYVSLHYSSRHMNFLHCFWGVGTIVSPYIMSMAISKSTWNMGYRSVSFIQFGIFLIILFSLPLWNIHKTVRGEGEKTEVLGLGNTLKIKGVITLLIGFFSYCAAEQTVMLWSGSYLHEVRNFSEEKAAAFSSMFFIGMTFGRFISGLVSDKIGDRKLIRIGTCIAFLGALILLLPFEFTFIGLFIIGLGCAPVYPAIIHSTPYNFGVNNSQAIIGVQMASAYVGSTLMPPVFGVISSVTGLGFLPVYVIIFLTLMTVMVGKTFDKN